MIKLLDWEELEERIELYKGESSEWDSSHAYIYLPERWIVLDLIQSAILMMDKTHYANV